MADRRSEMIWSQFGASIDMLENAIEACPDEVWGSAAGFQEFWYLSFHTLFWLDLYLHGPIEGFRPPEPFGSEELDPAGVFPDRVYRKDELLDYLRHCRKRLRNTLNSMDNAAAARTITHGTRKMSFEELLWYNMRHVQHHTAQLNLILRQRTDAAPSWVSKTKESL
ncbi:MAG TPA: DinB family protein [Pyrinomonadaceae bacterium]|nr:DinB family protein [Pyrinomonadaceae bacterium]HMP65527.1 DinB family protein [Pyrinomonadaceae bacterium]